MCFLSQNCLPFLSRSKSNTTKTTKICRHTFENRTRYYPNFVETETIVKEITNTGHVTHVILLNVEIVLGALITVYDKGINGLINIRSDADLIP